MPIGEPSSTTLEATSLQPSIKPQSLLRKGQHVSLDALMDRFDGHPAAALEALLPEFNRMLDEFSVLQARLVEFGNPSGPIGGNVVGERWQEERRSLLRARNKLQDDNRKLQEENRQLWKVVVSARGESKDATKENRDLRHRLTELETRLGGPHYSESGNSEGSGLRSRPTATRAHSDGARSPAGSGAREQDRGGRSEQRRTNADASPDAVALGDRGSAPLGGAPSSVGLGIESLHAISSTPARSRRTTMVSGAPPRPSGSPPVFVASGPQLSRGPRRKASSVDLGKAARSPDCESVPISVNVAFESSAAKASGPTTRPESTTLDPAIRPVSPARLARQTTSPEGLRTPTSVP